MDNFKTTPEKMIENCVQFLSKIYKQNNKKNGLIAVSGGIDSAVSLTLLTKALGRERVRALLLPYDTQDMSDAEKIVEWNKIPAKNVQIINIKPIVDAVMKTLNETGESSNQAKELESAEVGNQNNSVVTQDSKSSAEQSSKQSPNRDLDSYRLGNIMARARMIVLFDQAKKLNALVCGTENKSEKYLGYFTRFGDEASDIEPIQSFYKSQIRVFAEKLQLPEIFLKKSPSAGLWKDQTDEIEIGFSYEVADQVFEELIEQKSGLLYMQLIEGNKISEVTDSIHQALPELPKKLIQAVLERVQSQQFKHEVPYTTESNY